MRIFWVLSLSIFAAGCTDNSLRLHGSWKSDSDLSMSWNRKHCSLTETQDSGHSQIFGHMTVTYTDDGSGVMVMESYTLNAHRMPAFTDPFTYEVISHTTDTVVVKTTSGSMSGHVTTLYFDSPDVYWLLLDEDNPKTSVREYFRRIKTVNKKVD